jgi:hypothetical protein
MFVSLAPERWWQNGPYAAERLGSRNGRVLVRKERCRPLGGCFYRVRVSNLAIFDYEDCENSEERYFRLLKGEGGDAVHRSKPKSDTVAGADCPLFLWA